MREGGNRPRAIGTPVDRVTLGAVPPIARGSRAGVVPRVRLRRFRPSYVRLPRSEPSLGCRPVPRGTRSRRSEDRCFVVRAPRRSRSESEWSRRSQGRAAVRRRCRRAAPRDGGDRMSAALSLDVPAPESGTQLRKGLPSVLCIGSDVELPPRWLGDKLHVRPRPLRQPTGVYGSTEVPVRGEPWKAIGHTIGAALKVRPDGLEVEGTREDMFGESLAKVGPRVTEYERTPLRCASERPRGLGHPLWLRADRRRPGVDRRHGEGTQRAQRDRALRPRDPSLRRSSRDAHRCGW